MSGEYRDSPWRQGDAFALRDASGIDRLCIIASHDCDICADGDIEPTIEWLPLDLIEKLDGSTTYGKNPRKLHVALEQRGEVEICVQMDVRCREQLAKPDFFERASLHRAQPSDRDRTVFRRWLSARYFRSAFANEFEVQMTRVAQKIDALAKKKGETIRGLYFDVDDNTTLERKLGEDPYGLAIYVVYPPDTEDTVALEFAVSLGSIFTKEFLEGDTGIWQGIQLLSCDAISEDVMPLSLALSTKPWRVDHRSYSSQSGVDLYPKSAA